MSVFARFIAFEAIGWVASAVVLTWAARNEIVPVWGAWLLFAVWVAKDLVLFPLTRRAYEHGVTHGAGELIGAEVEVESTLDPEGWVRAGHERWRARIESPPLASAGVGDRVRVAAIDGLTLVVEVVSPTE